MANIGQNESPIQQDLGQQASAANEPAYGNEGQASGAISDDGVQEGPKNGSSVPADPEVADKAESDEPVLDATPETATETSAATSDTGTASQGDVGAATEPAKASTAGAGAAPQATAADTALTNTFERLKGQTALDTMGKIVQKGWAASDVVVIASATSYADALTANALAGSLGAPVLLTDPSSLSSQTLSEIKRLKAIVAYLIGGRNAIPAKVEAQIKQAGVSTTRLAGKTAQDTAIAVAERIRETRSTTAIVVTDASFQDALSIAPYSYATQSPIYFSSSKGTKLDAATAKAIRGGGYERVIIVGGRAAVKEDVETRLGSLGIGNIVRLKGATAEETSAAVAQWCIANGLSAASVGAATSSGYQDALCGAALCGKNNAPIVLIGPGNQKAIYNFVDPNRADIVHGHIFGGKAVVRPGSEYLLAHRRVQLLDNDVYTIALTAGSNVLLDLANSSYSDKANVQIYTSNSNPAQRWALVWYKDGFYSIVSVSSGKVVEIAGGKYALKTNVWQYGSNGTESQRWAIFQNSNGTYLFINKKSALSLEAAGGKTAKGTNILSNNTAASSKAQQFTIKKVPVLANGVYMFYSRLAPTSKAMDVSDASSKQNATLQLFNVNETHGQRYIVRHLGNNIFTLQAVNSAKYVTDSGGKVVQQQLSGNPKDTQKWKAGFKSGGIVFTNVATGKSIAATGNSSAAGTKLKTQAYSGAAGEHFRPRKVGIFKEGIYALSPVANLNLSMEVADGKSANKANVRLGKSSSSLSQKFLIESVGGGWYRILNISTGRTLDIAGDSAKSGANVQTYAYVNAKGQKWKIELSDDGYFVFTNGISGKALNVASSSPKSGTNVNVATKTSGKTQQFLLTQSFISSYKVDMNVPCYYQNPELPTGCESVALTNLIRFYGFNIGKTTIADKYLTYSGSDFVYSFMGNPYTNNGAAVMAPGLTNAGNRYLKAQGSSLRCKNVTGTSINKIKEYLKNGQPVLVWHTMYFGNVGSAMGWSPNYTMYRNTHALVVAGYDPSTDRFLVSDSLSGQVWRDASRFTSIYNTMGKQAIIIE